MTAEERFERLVGEFVGTDGVDPSCGLSWSALCRDALDHAAAAAR